MVRPIVVATLVGGLIGGLVVVVLRGRAPQTAAVTARTEQSHPVGTTGLPRTREAESTGHSPEPAGHSPEATAAPEQQRHDNPPVLDPPTASSSEALPRSTRNAPRGSDVPLETAGAEPGDAARDTGPSWVAGGVPPSRPGESRDLVDPPEPGDRRVGSGVGPPPDRSRDGVPGAVSPVVRLIPSSTEIAIGDPLSISVELSLGDDVGHVPFHLLFDPDVLRFDSAEEGPFLSHDGAGTVFVARPTTPGDALVVGLSRLSPAAGVDGDGRLCTLHFTAIGAGGGRLAFARATVRDSTNRIVPASFQATQVRVD